jgi:glycosyltransferase involved in cell wall biosynthesis
MQQNGNTSGTNSSINETIKKVAVIIPCYNHGNFIKDCLDSVVQQDYVHKSIVVINDGSTDNSQEIIEQLINIEDKQNNIVVGTYQNISITILINNKSTGPSAARNKAIKFAWNLCDYIAVLDADDRYLPDKLTKCMSIFNNSQANVGLVYNDMLIQDLRNGKIVHEMREPFDRHRLEQECIISNAPIISKKALEVVGLYDEEMRTCEDWDLWLRITEKFVAIHVPEPLHLYSVTGFNASFTVPKEIWNQNWTKIHQRLRQRMGQ